jgi:hypothetical protein
VAKSASASSLSKSLRTLAGGHATAGITEKIDPLHLPSAFVIV